MDVLLAAKVPAAVVACGAGRKVPQGITMVGGSTTRPVTRVATRRAGCQAVHRKHTVTTPSQARVVLSTFTCVLTAEAAEMSPRACGGGGGGSGVGGVGGVGNAWICRWGGKGLSHAGVTGCCVAACW